MVAPIIIAAGIAAVGALGSAALTTYGNKPNQKQQKESKTERQKRHLTDDLLRSLRGHGPYSDIFKNDEKAFERSFVKPAQERFQNQIAPGIQQKYIAAGQQRGTGLNDQLLRAGVDLDSLLNQHYMEFYQQGQNRKFGALNSALGVPTGAGVYNSGPTTGQGLAQGGAAFLNSDAFKDVVKHYSKDEEKKVEPVAESPRPGYATDYNPQPVWA